MTALGIEGVPAAAPPGAARSPRSKRGSGGPPGPVSQPMADELELSSESMGQAFGLSLAVKVTFIVDRPRKSVTIRVMDANSGEVVREIVLDAHGLKSTRSGPGLQG